MVAALLTHRGAVVVDADAISRAATAAGGTAIPAIVAAFGSEYIQADGAMDRDRMRSIAFSDREARLRLENIIHPIVGAEINRQSNEALARGARCVVVEIPLLVESSRWRALLHRIVTVDCSMDEQVRRVVLRSGMTESDARRIIAAQASRESRLLASDLVIQNDRGSMISLQLQVDQVADFLGL